MYSFSNNYYQRYEHYVNVYVNKSTAPPTTKLKV
jgi:hypothetical protein